MLTSEDWLQKPRAGGEGPEKVLLHVLLPVCFAEPLSAFISVRRRKFRWKITLGKREVLLEMSVFYQVAEGFVVAHLRGRRVFYTVCQWKSFLSNLDNFVCFR